MFYGKIIGGLIGLLAGGLIGLVIGLVIGHSFDRGLARTFSFATPEHIARIQDSFFATTFSLLGYLAKSDGRISREEIDHTEQIISQMGLDGQQRQRAIELFRRGAAPDFQLRAAVTAFNQCTGSQKQLQQTLLWFLITLALADDHRVEDAELLALQKIAGLMGYSPAQLQQLLRMAQAQEQFHAGAGRQPPARTSLRDAYSALGVAEGCSDQELKRAYRKLMSQNHPDKLIARGVPEDMIKIATGKSQEIQAAYELIREHRAA